MRQEFDERLGISPEVAEVSLILPTHQPALAYGTTIVIFKLFFPAHSGLSIRCECCLEHPGAKISVLKQPDDVRGRAAAAVQQINASCEGGTFEAHLLRINRPS